MVVPVVDKLGFLIFGTELEPPCSGFAFKIRETVITVELSLGFDKGGPAFS